MQLNKVMSKKVSEAQVKQQQAALLQANKDLEEFTYSVSHDLRAPLRSIDGFSRILEGKYINQLPQEAQHFLKLVRERTCEMEKQFDELFTLL